MVQYVNVVPQDEMWRDIAEWPAYAISSHGRIRNIRTNRYLHPFETAGYLQVQLWDNRKAKTYYIHRLVAAHFLSGWEDRYVVGWRDEDKYNNRIENLYFKGKTRLGHVIIPRKPIAERRLEIVELDRTFMTVGAAARFLQTSPQGIYQVLQGRRESHLSYHFRWIDV